MGFWVKGELASLEILRWLGCIKKAWSFLSICCSDPAASESIRVFEMTLKKLGLSRCLGITDRSIKREGAQRAFCNSVKPADIIAGPAFLLPSVLLVSMELKTL